MTEDGRPDLSERIPISNILAPEELDLLGQSSPKGEGVPYTPLEIVRGNSVAKIAAERERRLRGYHETSGISFALGYTNSLVVEFEDIDMQTGKILGEPKFLGFWDKEKGEVIPADDPEEFDREIKAKIEKFMKQAGDPQDT